MVHGCGAKTLKIFVFFFNFLAFLAGVAILVVCVLGYVDNPLKDEVDKTIEHWSEINHILNYTLYAGMAIGGLVILLGFLGCCGAIAESSCLLCLFAVILFILAAAQIAAGAVLLAKESLFDKELKNAIGELENEARKGVDKDNAACDFFETLSDKNICCFTCTTGTKQWNCKPDTQGKDCKDELSKRLQQYAKTAGGILIAIAAFEFIAIMFATCLCCSFR